MTLPGCPLHHLLLQGPTAPGYQAVGIHVRVHTQVLSGHSGCREGEQVANARGIAIGRRDPKSYAAAASYGAGLSPVLSQEKLTFRPLCRSQISMERLRRN